MMKKLLLIIIMILSCGGNVFANEWTNDDSIIRASVTYKDVQPGFWGYDAIQAATRYGWFAGYSDGTFKPNDVITRAEAAKAISEFLKLDTAQTIISSYNDVNAGSWYSRYVEAAKEMFYPTYGQEFKPSVSITREDALYVLVNAYGYNTLSECVDLGILDQFSDSHYMNQDMRKYLAVGLNYGILAGFNDGTLRPGGNLTRAQFATLLARLYAIGPNRVPTMAKLDHIELSCGTEQEIKVGEKLEIRAEAVYADGTRMDFTNNLNLCISDSSVIQAVQNRVYGMKAGQGSVLFNNANLNNTSIHITVN